MVWTDEPSYAQISTIYRWLSWGMPNADASAASKWIGEHATRQEVSAEMKRLKILFDKHALTKDNAFESEIWAGWRVAE